MVARSRRDGSVPASSRPGVSELGPGSRGPSRRCTLFGHRYRFDAAGPVMRWQCERGCGTGGAKRYGSAVEARRYAEALDREDRDEIGRRAPFLGMFPLRLAYWARQRAARRDAGTSAGTTGRAA